MIEIFQPNLVAASDASNAEKNMSSKICDGVSDEVEINQIITDGGFPVLSFGNFYTTSPIMAVNGMILKGQGRRSSIIHPTDTDAILCGNTHDMVLKDFWILSIGGYIAVNGINLNRSVIQRVQISEGGVNSTGVLIKTVDPVGNAYDNIIQDCVIRNIQYGIVYDWDGVCPSKPNNNVSRHNTLRSNVADSIGIWQKHGYKIDSYYDTITSWGTGIKVTTNSFHGSIVSPYLQTNEIGLQIFSDYGLISMPHDDGNTQFLDLHVGKHEQLTGIDISARITRASLQTIPSNVWTPIDFTNVNYDTDSMFTQPGITFNQGGKYVVNASLQFSVGSESLRGIAIQLNESTIIDSQVSYSGGYVRLSLSTTYNFNPGDHIDLLAFQQTVGNLDINASYDFSPKLTVSRL